MLWALKRTVSMMQFFWEPIAHVKSDTLEYNYNFTFKKFPLMHSIEGISVFNINFVVIFKFMYFPNPHLWSLDIDCSKKYWSP